MDALLGSMDPEHVTLLQGWMREHCGGVRVPWLPGDTWYSLVGRYRPPALVRAAWVLMAEHMDTGAPVSLGSGVADVYLGDPRGLAGQAVRGLWLLDAGAEQGPPRRLVPTHWPLSRSLPDLRAWQLRRGGHNAMSDFVFDIRVRADADHPIGVALDLWHRGTQWTDSFRADELDTVQE